MLRVFRVVRYWILSKFCVVFVNLMVSVARVLCCDLMDVEKMFCFRFILMLIDMRKFHVVICC